MSVKKIYFSVAPSVQARRGFTKEELGVILDGHSNNYKFINEPHRADVIIQYGIDNDVIISPSPTCFHWFFVPLQSEMAARSLIEARLIHDHNYEIIPVETPNDFARKVKLRSKDILNTLRVVMSELSAQMLTDSSITNKKMDYLGYDDFADALYAIIDHEKTCTPLTIAIDAPWGAGKTSLGHLVKNKLKTKPASTGKFPHVVCWFNAWMHDDSKNLSSSFTSHVAYAAHKKRSWWRRMINPIPVNLVPVSEQRKQRLFWFLKFSVASFIISTAIFTVINHNWISREAILDWLHALKIPTSTKLKTFLGTTGVFGFSYMLQFFFKYLLTTAKSINSYVKHPEEEARGGQIAKVRDELSLLVKQATPKGSKFVVFVDDLERCRPNGPIDLLEKINQLFPIENTVVVLMSDLQIIARMAEDRYAEQAVRDKCSFGRKYIQKIIQLQFDLPVTHNISKIESMVSQKIVERKGGVSKRSVSWFERFYVFNEAHYRPLRNIINTLNPLKILYRIYTLPLFMLHYLVDKTIYRHWKTNELTPTITGKIAVELANITYILAVPFLTILEETGFMTFHDEWHIILGVIIINGVAFAFNKIFCFIGLNEAIDEAREGLVKQEDTLVEQHVALAENGWHRVPEAMQHLVQKETEFKRLEQKTYFIDARKEAFELLQKLHMLNPRNVKRITNRIRLLLYVSKSRNILDLMDMTLVAKWAIITECWPELGKHIRNTGTVFLKQLETQYFNHTNPNSMFAHLINDALPEYEAELEGIKKVFEHGNPHHKLSDQLDMLTQFE